MLAVLVLLFAMCTSVAAAQTPGGTVAGHVRSEGTGAALRFATVEVAGPGRGLSVMTDSLGSYTLHGVPAGRRVLRVWHFDHAPHEVEVVVPGGGTVALDFFLELRPVRLEAVTARTRAVPVNARDTANALQHADLGAASVHVLEATPGVSELGLAEAARDVPGQEPPDPSDVLFVRGGAADLKLVLLDGAPVYAPFHLGGLINALDLEMLSSARLYLGGAPARYDGGVSYVMDMETRPARGGAHAVASLDLLSARTILEGPLIGPAKYRVGGRALHGLGGEPFVGDPFPYTYGDGLARLDVDLGRAGHIAATGFWNRESVRLDTLRAGEPAAWGNNAGSLRYRVRLGDVHVLATAAGGTFRTQLPIGGVRPLFTEGTADRGRFALDADRRRGAVRWQLGVSHDVGRYAYRAWAKGAPPDSTLMHTVAHGSVTGGYVEGTVQAGRLLTLRAGLRGDVFSLDPALLLAPRISGTFRLSDGSAFTVAAGRYRQYVRGPRQTLIALPTASPDTISAPALAIARADHMLAALDQRLSEAVSLSVEAFYKSFHGVPGAVGNRAESSGVDVWVRRGAGRVTGWLGYSLSWIWSLDQDRIRPTRVFSGRHLVSGGIDAPLPGGGIFEVRVGYGAGLPFTAIPEPEAGTPVFSAQPADAGVTVAAEIPGLPPDPDRPFVRLDAQLARTFRSVWGGHDFEVTPYVKVLNALNRRDALFYHFDRGHEDPRPRAIASIPVLPVVGVEWRF